MRRRGSSLKGRRGRSKLIVQTLHTGKTEAMILKANGFIGPLRTIMFGNAVITYVTNSTCLNLVIDNRLT